MLVTVIIALALGFLLGVLFTWERRHPVDPKNDESHSATRYGDE
jgi:hypothetical protein